jgi:hypothetical protein
MQANVGLGKTAVIIIIITQDYTADKAIGPEEL